MKLTEPNPNLLAAAVGPDRAGKWDALELLSASDRTCYWLREDPYWDGWLWDHPPTLAAKWTQKRETDHAGRIVFNKQNHFVALDSDEGKKLWQRCVNSPNVHRLLTQMNAFHHATTKQLHASSTFGWRKTSDYLKPLYDLGLVQRGVFSLDGRVPGRLPYLYALNPGQRMQRLLNDIPDDICRQMLGNNDRQIDTSGRHIRHDILGYETVLRTFETQPNVIAVAGEQQSGPQALFPGVKKMPSFTGDTTLYRHDGLRIVIEVAASRNATHLERTITKWASLLASLPRQDSGLVVVILNAHKTRHGQMTKNLRSILTKATEPGTLLLRNGAKASPDESKRARAQIHLASWEDWYPQPQSISEAGQWLHTAATPDGQRWVAFALADETSYTYQPRPGRNWPVPSEQTSLLTPAWAGIPPINGPEDLASSPALTRAPQLEQVGDTT